MRTRTIAIGILVLFYAAGLAAAQSGQDLYQQGLGKEQLGDYEGAIKIYERIVRDFARNRSLVARTKVHLGDCWIKLGEAKGLDFLSDVINNYKDQTDIVADARRLAARSSSVSRPSKWTERDFLLVAEFKNGTGETIFDSSLSAALSFQLSVTPYLDVFPYSRVRETLRLRRPQDDRLTHAAAQEICEKAGVKGILLPSIDGADGRYVITLEVVNCGAGERVARAQVEAASREKVLSQLGKAALSLRAALGESPESLRQFEPREITTNSFEALEAYAQGYRERVSGAFGSANITLKRAVKLDPKFAAAYSLLASLNINNDESRSNAIEAFALRNQVSERERLFIEAQYQTTVLGNVDKTVATLERLRDLYPRDGDVRSFLGDQYRLKGMFEPGLKELQAAVQLNPGSATARDSLMRNYMELGRFLEARAVYEDAVEQGVATTIGIHIAMYSMARTLGDAKAMQAEIEYLNKRVGVTGVGQALITQAQVAALSGDIVSARKFREELLAGGAIAGIKAFLVSGEARVEALFGEIAEVGGLVEQSFRLSRVPIRLASAVVAYGLAGNLEKLKPLVDEIKDKYPEDTLMNKIWIPTALAAAEIQEGNGAGAIHLLEPAGAYEPSANSLWAIYVRGLAYLQTKSGRAAAAEFQKIIDHHAVDLLSPLYPLAHMRLAEAHALQGDVPQARKLYQSFFTFWKDADPAIPVLKEAKAKYSSLLEN